VEGLFYQATKRDLRREKVHRLRLCWSSAVSDATSTERGEEQRKSGSCMFQKRKLARGAARRGLAITGAEGD